VFNTIEKCHELVSWSQIYLTKTGLQKVVRTWNVTPEHMFKVSVSTEGKRPLEGLRVNRRIILERISEKYFGKLWAGFIWLRIGSRGGVL
jgi:hypothetical protein